MAPIKIDHILSFSSEDSVHTASNLLSEDFNKKWKCKTPGEKQAIVILQLEKASQITAIDVGNEHSAYVEILVSRSLNAEDYKVLLAASSFMTPVEARSSQNINKVRMFTQDQLSEPERNEKWDRVKIVCTQPFNKHVQYGLSFIVLHSIENKTSTTSSVKKIGNFLIRSDSSDNLSFKNLFANRKKEEDKPHTITAAAAIRDAASSSSLLSNTSPFKTKLINKNSTSTTLKQTPTKEEKKDRNRNELYYDEEDLKSNEKIERILKKDQEKQNTPNKRKHTDTEDTNNENKKRPTLQLDNKKDVIKNKKVAINESKKNNTKTKKPFNKLLEGVNFVISGIINPERAEIRSKALEMGAKYKKDWDSTCTHLICAFVNTPKFNQVKGKGKIVKKTWVENCYSERKRIPWRRHALDKQDTSQKESEDEIEELIDLPNEPVQDSYNDDDDDHKADGSDTEERVAAILAKKKQQEEEFSSNEINDSIYEANTDEESEVPHKFKLYPPDLFQKENIYVDKKFDEETYSKLCKYIRAFNGNCVDSPKGNVHIIITTKENSLAMKEINENATCVGKEWIFKCCKKQTTLPLKNFGF